MNKFISSSGCIGIEYRQKSAETVSATPLPILPYKSIGDTDTDINKPDAYMEVATKLKVIRRNCRFK